jgi:hypothetical protein
MKFNLSPDLILDSQDPRIQQQGLRAAVIGQSGAGKSWTIALIAEQALDQALPVVIIDPHGEYWPLAEVYPQVLIVGGENGDLPLAEEAVEVYSRAYRGGSSLVFNLKDFFIDEEAYGRLVERVLRSLWKAQVEEPRPALWVLEEAQLEVPQEKSPDVVRRVGLIKGIATGGRKFGVNLVLGTQRPAELHKTPLSQCWLRFFGGLAERLDRDAVKDYLRPLSADQLKNLPTGEFYVFGWGEPFLTRIRSDRRTRHGAETPQMAPVARQETQRASIQDLRALVETALDRAREEKGEMARLNTELGKREREIEELRRKADVAGVLREALAGAPPGESPEAVARALEEGQRELEGERQRRLPLEAELASLRDRVGFLEAEKARYDGLAEGVEALRQGFTHLGLGLDEERLVARLENRLRSARQEVPPPPMEALKDGFIQEQKEAFLRLLSAMPPTHLRAIAYLESVRGRATWTGLSQVALGRAPSGKETSALRDALAAFVRADRQGRVYPGLHENIRRALEPYKGNEEQTNALYNSLMAEVVGKVPVGIATRPLPASRKQRRRP